MLGAATFIVSLPIRCPAIFPRSQYYSMESNRLDFLTSRIYHFVERESSPHDGVDPSLLASREPFSRHRLLKTFALSESTHDLRRNQKASQQLLLSIEKVE
jgi:hypothetical protein